MSGAWPPPAEEDTPCQHCSSTITACAASSDADGLPCCLDCLDHGHNPPREVETVDLIGALRAVVDGSKARREEQARQCYPCRRGEHATGPLDSWTAAHPSKSAAKCACSCHATQGVNA